MKTLREKSLLILGYIIFSVGVVGGIVDFVARTQFSFPFDLGIVLGNSSVSLLGLVTIAVVQRLEILDRRLKAIEDNLPPKSV